MQYGDHIGRMGGEEFVLVLPGSNRRHARDTAERIRVGVENLRVTIGDTVLSFTVSIGVAECDGDDTAASLVERADQAMYAAKRSGRNRVVVATGNAPFDAIIANTTYRDIFFDAPLAQMYDAAKLSTRGGQGTVGTSPNSHFDSTNSYYASVDFRKAIGFVWWGTLSPKQLDLVRGQIKGAHERGLKARYWSAP
ncbi:MAG: Altered inheritance of mitochondria protein 6, partial [Watsoniomyces obsoletus]